MWRYLKAAFFAGVDVPALGRLPVNILALVALGILGVGQPAFWFLGAGLETAFLFSLAFNKRFQKVVDAENLQLSSSDAWAKRQALIRLLPQESQQRLLAFKKKGDEVLQVYRNQQAENFVVDTSREAVERLEWVYLKLLVARHHLLSVGNSETEDKLEAKIAKLQEDLKAGQDSPSLRNSKAATLAILKKRLANVGRREESLEEIDSDLTRVEAQLDLILENASMQGKPEAISTDIELASDLAGGAFFGESEPDIADLDEAYSPGKKGRERLMQGSTDGHR